MRKQKGTDYYANRHSCFLLQYHLVVVTKFRHPVLVGDVRARFLEIAHELLGQRWDCNILEINTDGDHAHILFEAPPQVQLSALVNNFKTVTARLLRKECADELRKYYWKPYFWSDSYFVCTVSEHSLNTVRQYITNQGG